MKKKQEQTKLKFEERRREFLAKRRELRLARLRHIPVQDIIPSRRSRSNSFRKMRDYIKSRNLLPDPDKSEKLAKIAAIYSELKMDDEMHEVARQAYRANPKNQKVVTNLAIFCIKEKKYHLAERYAEELRNLYNGEVEGEFLLGKIYFYQEEWLLAKKYSLSVTKKVGKWKRPMPIADIHCMIATCCKKLGDDAGSLIHLKKALECEPRNATTLFQLGLHHGQAATKHEHKPRWSPSKSEKIKYMKKARATKSPASIYFGNLTKSKQFFQKSAKIKPTIAVYNNLANTLSLLGKHSEALKTIKKALNIDKDHMKALVTKTSIQLRMDKITEALDTINEALYMTPNSLNALKLKSEIQERLEDWAGYYETNWHIAKYSEEPTDKEIANVCMATSYMQRQNFKKANSILDKYLKENPTSHTALHKKFDLAMTTKKFSKALDLATKMYKITPDIHTERLAIFPLIKLGKMDKAFKLSVKVTGSPDLDPLTAHNLLDIMYNYAHRSGITDKKNIRIILAACKKIEKKFPQFPTIELNINEIRNWVNAINGKEKEFDILHIKTKKIRARYNNDKFTTRDYNYACAFALSGNTNKALKLLKMVIRLDKKYLQMAKKDKDFQNLFESKKFIELTHERKKS